MRHGMMAKWTGGAGLGRAFTLASLLALSAGLAGCASFLGGGAEQKLATFDLGAPAPAPATKVITAQVLVPEPTALKALNSERILVRPNGSEIAYLPGAQWSDRLPHLIQQRLVQTFENVGHVRAGTPGQGLSIDYQVVSELRSFDYDAGTHKARIELGVKLMNDRTGKVVASDVFAGEAPVADDTPGSVTAGLDALLMTEMKAIVAWTVKRL